MWQEKTWIPYLPGIIWPQRPAAVMEESREEEREGEKKAEMNKGPRCLMEAVMAGENGQAKFASTKILYIIDPKELAS